MKKILIKENELKNIIKNILKESNFNNGSLEIIKDLVNGLNGIKSYIETDMDRNYIIGYVNGLIKSGNEGILQLRKANMLSDNIIPEEVSIDETKKSKGKAKIAKVMGEFSKGDLKTSYDTKVTDPKQAVAIAYSEAGLTKKKNESIEESITKRLQSVLSESTKTIKNRIYTKIGKLGLNSHKFHDEYWQGVRAVIEAIGTIDGVTDVSYGVKDGGYRKNNDGTQWKEYLVTIETIQGTVEGILNAHAAGTVQDPFSSYDVNLVLW